ncbi:hypothetical protein MP478_05445 [Chryseobacterium sp. WG14]|uniref:hypothetical protein n=1 Tax=unclassified Chryseobacterium TaxID=2593645 RepID=UPI00211EB174|nr:MULTISPECIES: hypothetical protein [unclassified Chryseobacterium]MCQ9635368.1 hypothetical protein [Chryseobacterium sp. WG23]MCQ9638828.1 hypothetical protein [Chryseobacterium sp. WG14]
MKYVNKTVCSLAVAGMTMLSGNISAQFLGGHRLTSDEEGPKGQFMVYGSLDYSKVTTPSTSSSTVSSAPLGVGYFINNNDLIGVNYAYSQNSVDHHVMYKQNEAGIWYSPSLMLGKYFVLIGQVDAHYVWGQQLSGAADSMQNFNGFRLRAYPLIGILLGGGWALKFKFAELSMLQTKTKQEGWTKSYVAGLSGSTFGVGISKNFDFRKKSAKDDN